MTQAPIRSRISARPAGFIARRHEARLAAAAAAYERWEQAIAANLPHSEVVVRWDSYVRLAELAR